MMSENVNVPHNGYALDPESPTELARLIKLDAFTTKAMGGPLSGLEQHSLNTVLDVACGPGSWVLDVAFARPDAEVAGIDISRTMIGYAGARARSQGLLNASFEVMDITGSLCFADETFDLVNARFLAAVLHRDAWPTFLRECVRVLRPGGVLRLTETDHAGWTTSPANEELSSRLFQALQRAGYGPSPRGHAMTLTAHLERFLRTAGLQQIGQQAHAINFSSESAAWADLFENARIAFQHALPLVQKMGLTTEEEWKHLLYQLEIERRAADFSGIWYLLTVWGTRSE